MSGNSGFDGNGGFPDEVEVPELNVPELDDPQYSGLDYGGSDRGGWDQPVSAPADAGFQTYYAPPPPQSPQVAGPAPVYQDEPQYVAQPQYVSQLQYGAQPQYATEPQYVEQPQYAPQQQCPVAPAVAAPVVEELPPATAYFYAQPEGLVPDNPEPEAPVVLERRGWFGPLITFLVLTGLIFACMAIANLIQHDFGHVEISHLNIAAPNNEGYLASTVYRPLTARADQPRPGILLLHNHLNDRSSVASLATELSRRGYVVMAVDQFGHGDSTIGLGGNEFTGEIWPAIDAINTSPDLTLGGALANSVLAQFPFVDSERMAVLGDVSPLPQNVAATIEWLDQSLTHYSGWSPHNHLYLITTSLVFAATLLAVAALVPLLELLLSIPFFASATGPLHPRAARVKSGWQWWRGALPAILLAVVSYPFLTWAGHHLIPFPAQIFSMSVGNGILTWFVFLTLMLLLALVIPWRSAAKRSVPMQWGDLGAANTWDGSKFGWGTFFRSVLLSVLALGYLYGLSHLFRRWFGLEFRLMWPLFRPFMGTMRLWQFLIYLPFFIIFFVMLSMVVFGRMGSPAAARPGWRGFMSCWWRAAVWLLGGLLILGLLHYLPYFLGMGFGFDYVGLGAFAGLFMSLLWLLVPLILLLTFLVTAIYRKTGQAFLTGLVPAILAAWIIAGATPFI